MDRRKFSVLVVSVLALVALFWGVDQGLAVTGPTPGVNYNVANYANSPLPKGPVATITVTNGGRGYSSSPLPVVTITDFFGVGTNATATATVTAGKVTSIAITNGGANYIAPLVTITGGSGSGAAAWAAIGGSGVNGGMRKFVDKLPGLGPANANLLGQYIPVASPGTLPGFPNDDYYEIALVEYREQMHSDLPPVVGGKTNPAATGGTKLRGYVQEVNGVTVGKPHYLGPLIIATVGQAGAHQVYQPTSRRAPAGNLFLPVDATVMGAGEGPLFLTGIPVILRRRFVQVTRRTGPLSISMAAIRRGSATGRPTNGLPLPGKRPLTRRARAQQNVPDMPRCRPSGSMQLFTTPTSRQPADVLPRPCLWHHPPECLCRRWLRVTCWWTRLRTRLQWIATRIIPGLADSNSFNHPGQDLRARSATQLAATDPLWMVQPIGAALGRSLVPPYLHAEPGPGDPDLSGA